MTEPMKLSDGRDAIITTSPLDDAIAKVLSSVCGPIQEESRSTSAT